jgi:hypothetical protein
VWGCPACLSDNPIEASACLTCGTPFGRLMEEASPTSTVAPGRAMAFSLIFPGLGHFVAGRGAEGLARAVIFAYAVGTALMVLISTSARPGPFLSLLVASVLVAGTLYVLSATDAARAARGEPPLLTPRLLLYGGAGLILLSVVILVVAGLRASGAGN